MNFSYYLLNKNSYYFGEQETKYLGDLYEDLEHHDSDDLMAEHVYIGDQWSNYHIHLSGRNVLYCQIRGKKIFMAFDYSWYFHMTLQHLKRLPKNIKVTNYTVETGDCLCIPPWIMHAAQGYNKIYKGL